MKDSTPLAKSFPSAVQPNWKQLRREKIHAIERGDDFATHKQLLQVVAIAELVVTKKADPKVCGGVSVLG
jgi:hypothetical protein